MIEFGNGVSKEVIELWKLIKPFHFLKGCFVRLINFRFTCEMLLLHPFLQGLDDDAGVDVDQSVPFNPIESFAPVYDDEEDEEFTTESSSSSARGMEPWI